jgi:hypothetical protein
LLADVVFRINIYWESCEYKPTGEAAQNHPVLLRGEEKINRFVVIGVVLLVAAITGR